MAQKLYPASNPRDDRLFDELFYRQYLLDHPNPVVTVTTPPVPDSEFTITHDLGRIPSGYLVIHSSEPVHVYGSKDNWTKTDMTIKATEGSVECTILVL